MVETIPAQFYSATYNELNQNKTLFDIWKSQEMETITNFEEKFALINNYYEQYETFCKFVECNSGVVAYEAIGGEEKTEKKEEEKKNEIDPSKIDFYELYGLLLLKFCKYHQYVFLNKQPENKPKEKENEQNNEENNVRVVFLLDKIKQLDEGEKTEEPKKEEPIQEVPQEKKNDEKNGDTKDAKVTDDTKEKDNKGNKKIENILNEKLFSSVTD